MIEITQKYLLETFLYQNGSLIWKKSRKKINAGDKAGTVNDNGYIVVGLNRKRYRLHHLIWLLHYGTWPKQFLDHINCNKFDNKIENLREANFSQNNANRPRQKNNSTGFKNVYYHPKTNKYRVRIKKISFGLYASLEEANKMAIHYRNVLFGEFSNNL